MFKIPSRTVLILILASWYLFVFPALAQENSPRKQTSKAVEVNGDRVEFFAEAKKMVAEGNVVINYQDAKLVCKKVTVYTETKDVYAEGDVHLYSPKGEISGEKLKYNFEKQAGILYDAKFTAAPYFGAGKTIQKINANEMRANQSYMTTCDLEKPHYRIATKQTEIFPGSKLVAKKAKFVVGKIPLLYLPQYVHRLDDKRPRVTMMPGKDKDWGGYLLQAWRYYFNDNAKGRVHLDYREKKDLAWGVDFNYKVTNGGEGLIRTYYTHERNIQTEHLWEVPRSTKEKERFKAEWRHKWDMDDRTMAIWQYYRLKDSSFLKDYFKREYEKSIDPNTFFLLTHTFPSATLSFDIEKRVNRFTSATEKLPEIKIDASDQKIGASNFYFKNSNSFATLTAKNALPSDYYTSLKQTERVDSYNQLSYPDKIGFIETRPYIGVRQTYFSRDNSHSNTNLIRGVFYSGADLSTKFYRLFDVNTDFAGLDIHKIRHIINPTIAYAYIHPPTIPSSKLNSFDSVDSIDRTNKVSLSLENKLQTKKSGSSVDLLRLIFTTDRTFKQKPKGTRFNHFNTDLEIRPYDWLSFYADSDYDMRLKKFSTANFDLGASGGDNWNIGLGHRYQREVSNQITTDVAYRLNPKWKLRAYERFEFLTNTLKEQEYGLIRDLHCWTMEITLNTTRGLGNSIWIVFRIKAFPETGFDFDNSFHQRKSGSQTSEE